MSARLWLAIVLTVVAGLLATVPLGAHTGPPFPIVQARTVGPYDIAVWSDPDSTDDGSPGGRFWVTLHAAGGAAVAAGTRVNVTVAPANDAGRATTVAAEPEVSNPSQRFAAVVMDHEGRFAVRVTVDGPLGAAVVDAEVDATYDLRPSTASIVILLIPFGVVGLLWIKVLLRRRV